MNIHSLADINVTFTCYEYWVCPKYHKNFIKDFHFLFSLPVFVYACTLHLLKVIFNAKFIPAYWKFWSYTLRKNRMISSLLWNFHLFPAEGSVNCIHGTLEDKQIKKNEPVWCWKLDIFFSLFECLKWCWNIFKYWNIPKDKIMFSAFEVV